jgi:arylsulfatase
MNTWPDAGTTPFRSEKNTNWEGAFRVPEMVRWPGKIPPGVVSNEIIQHHDWLPTFLAAAGEPDIVEKLKRGHEAAGKTYKVHIDGFNLLPFLTGEVDKSPRNLFIYFSDDGDVLGIRFDNWKAVFMEQRQQGTLQIWAEPFVSSALRSCSTCARTPSSAPTSPRTPTGTGSSTAPSSCWHRRTWSVSSSRRSRNSRPASTPRASRSTRQLPSSKRHSPPASRSKARCRAQQSDRSPPKT